MTISITAPARRTGSVQCLSGTQLHRMIYDDWGDPDNPEVVVCVHGLTRNRRDFELLASALADRFRVIAPDVAGRGESDWLRDPANYAVPVYMQHMVVLLARLACARVHWVGSSMGGLIGMGLASLDEAPIRRLVLNDIGPRLELGALARIAGYVGHAPVFASLAEAEACIRAISSGFGHLPDEAWHALSASSVRQDPEGWRMRYDPAIGDALRASLPALQSGLWSFYERIVAPVLVLRGAQSDLLTLATAEQMTRCGPKARLVEIPDTGHAPMLMKPHEIGLIREFLLEG